MDAHELIESYVDDVAVHLPRRLRNDVGLELRALLVDELNAAAKDVHRPADEQMALELLRRFGSPADVASRYRPRGFHLIQPEHAPLFVKLSMLCVGVQWALTLPPVFRGSATFSSWWTTWGLGALVWVGALLLYFAGAAWICRVSPADPVTHRRPWTHWILWLPMSEEWRPRPTRSAGGATKTQIVLAVVVTLFFTAPASFLDVFLADASWARYDATFSRWLLIPLLGLLAARIALSVAAMTDARRRASTETVRFVLWVVSVAGLYWAAFAWDIFATPTADALFKGWLTVFLLINTVQIAAGLRRTLAHVRAV